MKKNCIVCKIKYNKKSKSTYKEFEQSLYCSRACKGKHFSLKMKGNNYGKGFFGKHSYKTKQKISTTKKRNPTRYWLGKKRSPETIEKMQQIWKGVYGSKHPRWIIDRDKLKISDRQSGHKYRLWRKAVFTRDKHICKISNGDCSGILEAHHILRWRDYPELRYETNNGISLCHFHHPRKILEEQRLIGHFYTLTLTG